LGPQQDCIRYTSVLQQNRTNPRFGQHRWEQSSTTESAMSVGKARWAA
jgi:hypothetical protein